MQSVLRLFIWMLALLFAASPVLLSIVSSPSHQGDLLDPSSYANYSRDIAFVVIALIAIGIVDALEVVATRFGNRPAPSLVAGGAFILAIVFIPQLMLFVTWAAPGIHLTTVDIRCLPTYGTVALACAFGARLAAIWGS